MQCSPVFHNVFNFTLTIAHAWRVYAVRIAGSCWHAILEVYLCPREHKMHMQQTHSKSIRLSPIRHFRLAGMVASLALVIIMTLSYVPVSMAFVGQGLVSAATCSPEDPDPPDD